MTFLNTRLVTLACVTSISLLHVARTFTASESLAQRFAGVAATSAPRDSIDAARCLTDAEVYLSASSTLVTYPESSLLKWSVELPDGCSAVTVRLDGAPVARTGSRRVRPARSTTYTIQLRILAGQASLRRWTRVEVAYPPRVVITPETADPVGLLVNALTDPMPAERKVELCGVDLDLTGLKELQIPDHRSLVASEGCERGPRRAGPRLFIRESLGQAPLFVIRGDNVSFSGFRLEGPTPGIGSGDGRLETGIRVFPYDIEDPISKIEISNMEIYFWSGSAVNVGDVNGATERGRLSNIKVGAVTVKNNYLHHNRHDAGNGYGVSVVGGAYALIERNVFEENRHAISGSPLSADGKDVSGYTARDNLILPGGGLHCVDKWLITVLCWRTHQIDMHGSESAWYEGGEACCGLAGETIMIQRNTVLYTGGYVPLSDLLTGRPPVPVWSSGNAIKIRGNPTDRAVVDGNVFKHVSDDDAIAQNGNAGAGDNITNPIDIRPNNVFGFDPSALLASCDFQGDGKRDLFMATGVTWWVQSAVTKQWRHLNTMPHRLSALQLGDINSDGVCDVAIRPANANIAPRAYSRSGTSRWIQLHQLVRSVAGN